MMNNDIEREEFEKRWKDIAMPSDLMVGNEAKTRAWHHFKSGWQARDQQAGSGEAVGYKVERMESGDLVFRCSDGWQYEPYHFVGQTLYTHPSASVPDDLRTKGLTVAVHNDYRLNGESHTFWLLTDADGMSYKGEGRTDAEALNAVRAMLTAAPQPVGDGWIECSERLSTAADEDCLTTVWVYDISTGEVELSDGVDVQYNLSDFTHWMPTGLKRPAPPQTQEDE